VLRGVLLKVASTLAFMLMATLVKLLSDRFPVGEITFARSFFALVPVAVWAAAQGGLRTVFRTSRPGAHLTRSLVGVTAMFLGFAALARLPLADSTAISFTAPLITVALAALILHEQVRIYRWSAVAIGFVGVLIILSGYAEEGAADRSVLGAAFQLAAAAGVALVSIQIRHMTRTEPAATIVIYFSIFSTLVALLTVPFGWAMPTATEAAALLAIGILGGIGQVTMTESFRHADASLLAPFDYVSLIWALAISVIVFGTLPTGTMLTGAAVVIAAGLFVLYRERQLRIARRKAGEIPPAMPGATP
jgi:drug/metabolite transporter (DMT)-like permease